MSAKRTALEDRIEARATEEKNRTVRIVLSERDTERVLALLEDPPKPTAALKAAARRRTRT